MCLWVESEWWNKVWVRPSWYPVCSSCVSREIHEKLFPSGGVCPWALQIFQPGLAGSCSCAALLVLNDELLHLSMRKPGFAFRHQWFIAHFIYFSKAVTSVSANPAPSGLLRLAAPTWSTAQFSLWPQAARRRLFLSKWDLPVATVSFPEEDGFGMAVLKGISGAKCFLKCLGKSVYLPALFQ